MHHEALDRDPAWDCTLIKTMREKGETIVNPIYEWTDGDVWEYIRENKIKTNPLYECGWHRVGCLFCPLSTYQEKKRNEAEFPKYKEAYIRAFERLNEERRLKNNPKVWSTGEEVYNWWIEEYKHNVKGQITMEEYLKGVDATNERTETPV